MHRMYLLTREVSAYSFNTPLVLGLFYGDYQAKKARSEYLAQAGEHDPFAKQAYWDIDLEAQVNIREAEATYALRNNVRVAYLMTAMYEQFGQVELDLTFLTGERQRCDEFLDNYSRSGTARPVSYWQITELPLNQLLDPERQEIQLPSV